MVKIDTSYAQTCDVDDEIKNIRATFDSTIQVLDRQKPANDVIDELSDLEKNEYTLSEEDFKQYFEGENFCQGNVGDCRLVAAIDSFVSYGDYERLIRTNVEKTDKGFSFSLPFSSSLSEKYFVSFDEIAESQRDISGNQQFLVTGKLGIQALLILFGKVYSGLEDKYDYNRLHGGVSFLFFTHFIPNLDNYVLVRSLISEKEDPKGSIDKVFTNKLYSVLESFNTETDMLVLHVCQLLGKDMDYQKSYSNLGHYSKHNHVISVEKVKKEDGKMVITLSNPWNSNMTYDITFENLIKACAGFELCTKNKNYSNIMDGIDEVSSDDKFADMINDSRFSSDGPVVGKIVCGVTKVPQPHTTFDRRDFIIEANRPNSVNKIVSITGEENQVLKKARKDIIVSDDNGKLKVSSYGLNINMEEQGGNVVIYLGENKLYISKSQLSNKYEYCGNVIQDNNYPLYLYGAKIANFINMMRKKYINTKSRDKKNPRPFTIKNGKLEFDDDPGKFSGKEWMRRRGAALVGDDTITVLDDWSKLGISPTDTNTKQKIADFLNKLIK